MTKDEYMQKFNVQPRTMDSWLKKGWIRGVVETSEGTLHIPDAAKRPYSQRNIRVANTVGMYSSIVRGCGAGLDVFPALYDMVPERFNFFVDRLIELDYIHKITIESIEYLEPTEKCRDCKSLSSKQLSRQISLALTAANALAGLATACANL